MSALYQRARPVRFDEVVGQEHVIEVLGSAVERGRIGHAYLFSGPRGVGKTTTARLLAMAANCEHEDASARPCGTCDSCRLVQAGSHPDVTELDAASNNSVEDVRDLREKVGLAGLRGGTRVWILDEAHMLSRAAANALLKTLEEPPPGLLFILATTEPEKLPPTILSRCQHFRFRRLSEDEIVGKLQTLAAEAEVDAEAEALHLVARVADGGMRDAESMLERLLLVDDGITARAAEDALGLPPTERLQTMASALATRELETLLDEADALYRAGFSPRTLAEQLTRTLRDALVASVKEEGFRLDLDDRALMRAIQTLDDEMERFLRHNDLYALEVALIKGLNALDPQAVAPSAVLAAAQAGDVAERADAAGSARSQAAAPAPPPFEPNGARAGRPAARAPASGTRAAPRPSAPPTNSGPASGSQPHASRPNASRPTAAASSAAGTAQRAGDTAGHTASHTASDAANDAAGGPARKPLSWRAVKAKAGAQLKAFLMPAQESVEDTVVRLKFDAVHRFHFEQLLGRSDELAALVEEVAGPGYTILVEGPEGGAPKKIA